MSSTKYRRFSHRPKLGEAIGPFTIDSVVKNRCRPMYTGIDSASRKAFIKGPREDDTRYGTACLTHEFDVLVNLQRHGAIDHVCKVVEPGSDHKHGIPFIFLGYSGDISLERACKYGVVGLTDPLAKVTRTLQEVHKKGIVHRDLKPSNIRLNGGPTIVDFGSAMYLDVPSLFYTWEAGTPGFTSSEQADGGAPTIQSDIFSVCALWYFVLEGRAPFNVGVVANEDGDDEWVTFFDRPTFRPEYLIEKYGEFGRILVAGLSKNPADRPPLADIGDVAERQFKAVYVPPEFPLSVAPPSESPISRGSSSGRIPQSPAHACVPYAGTASRPYSGQSVTTAQPA